MTSLVSCARCGTALATCPACGAGMRAGLCQVVGRDDDGRPRFAEEFYCPTGCDADRRFTEAATRWRDDHPCPPRPSS